MRTSSFVLAAVAAANLSFLSACRSGDSTETSTAKALGVPSPVDSLEPAAAQEEEPQIKSLRDQKIQVLVASFVDETKQAMQIGDLEKAYTAVSHAIELDPGNPEVMNLHEMVSLQLGRREATVGEIRRSAEDVQRVRSAQARLEVENKRVESRRLADQGDLDGAIRALEDAQNILRWHPYVIGPSDEAGNTEKTIHEEIEALRRQRVDLENNRRAELERIALSEKAEREKEEQQRTQNLLVQLMRKANESFHIERYREAESYCDQILELDPEHKEAAELKTIAADAFHAAVEEKSAYDFKYHWREIFDKLEFDNLPVVDLVQHPSKAEWQRIKNRGPISFSLTQTIASPEDVRVNEILDSQMVEVNFADTSLVQAIEWFRVTTGLNFLIDPAVRDDSEATVNMSSPTSMVARKALDLLMKLTTASTPITYRVRNGLVHILPAEAAPGGQILEIYDVRDLTKPISSFQTRDFHLAPSSAFQEEEPEPLDPTPIVVEGEKLSELIQTNIAPSTWEDAANTLTVLSGALVVRQSADVHQQIKKLLADLRHNSGTLVNIETRFLSLEDRFLEDIGVDFRGLNGQNGSSDTETIPNVPLDDFGTAGSGGVGSPTDPEGIGTDNSAGAFFTEGGDLDLRGRVENLYDLTLGDEQFQGSGGLALEFTYIDDTLVEAVLRAVQKSKQAEIIHAPHLTVFNGQRANIQNVEQITYLKDFEVEIAQGAVVADPVIDILRDGTILDVKPVVSADRRFITMEVRPTLAQVLEPIPLFETSLAVGNEVEIQLPEIQIQRIRTTVTIPDGSTLMLGGLNEVVNRRFESGMPFFRQIPFVSFLFGRKGVENSRKKTMILVRAKIIIPEESAPF